MVTAYSPLANPTIPFRKATDAVLLDDPVILKLAEMHHKSAAQVNFVLLFYLPFLAIRTLFMVTQINTLSANFFKKSLI